MQHTGIRILLFKNSKISLLSISAKVYNKIQFNRIRNHVDPILSLKSGQGIGHSRWLSRGVPMDPNSENAFPEEIFDYTRYISRQHYINININERKTEK